MNLCQVLLDRFSLRGILHSLKGLHLTRISVLMPDVLGLDLVGIPGFCGVQEQGHLKSVSVYVWAHMCPCLFLWWISKAYNYF